MGRDLLHVCPLPSPSGWSTRMFGLMVDGADAIVWAPERTCMFRIEDAVAEPAAMLEQVEIGTTRLLYTPMPLAPRGQSYYERLYAWEAAVRAQVRKLEMKYVMLALWEYETRGILTSFDDERRAEAEAAAGPKPQPTTFTPVPIHVEAHTLVRFVLHATERAQVAITIAESV